MCLDVSTRWNFTYLMLDVIPKFKKAFQRLKDENRTYCIDFSNG